MGCDVVIMTASDGQIWLPSELHTFLRQEYKRAAHSVSQFLGSNNLEYLEEHGLHVLSSIVQVRLKFIAAF